MPRQASRAAVSAMSTPRPLSTSFTTTPTGRVHAPVSPSVSKLRNAAHRATAFNTKKEKVKKEDSALLPVEVTLGKTKLVFSEQGWRIDSSILGTYEKKVEELTREIKDIQHQAEKWERDSRNARHGGERLVEESNMFKFKNQLLIEMLAIAQLDEQQAVTNYQREKIKADEYRGELERCYARMIQLGLDPSLTLTTTSNTNNFNFPTTTGKELDASLAFSTSQPLQLK